MDTYEERAVIDTCVLPDARVADVLLRLARKGAHKVFWSQRILNSTYRVQRERLGWEQGVTDSYHSQLAKVFPDAVISGHERWIEQCTNEVNDRHVLACAIEARAKYIVTYNTDDFVDADLAPWNIRALKPSDYLLMLYLKDEPLFWTRLGNIAVEKQTTTQAILNGLLRDCRKFVSHLLAHLNQ